MIGQRQSVRLSECGGRTDSREVRSSVAAACPGVLTTGRCPQRPCGSLHIFHISKAGRSSSCIQGSWRLCPKAGEMLESLAIAQPKDAQSQGTWQDSGHPHCLLTWYSHSEGFRAHPVTGAGRGAIMAGIKRGGVTETRNHPCGHTPRQVPQRILEMKS